MAEEAAPGRSEETGRFVEGNDIGAEGRTSVFRDEMVEQARKLAQLGAVDREIADFFEISVRQLRRWKHSYPDFADALTVGKGVADDRVEQSLYHKAIGYSFDSEKIFCDKGQVVRATTVEHVAPDTTAAIFWLKNRRPADWRDSSQIDHRSSDGSMSPQAPVYNITDK